MDEAHKARISEGMKRAAVQRTAEQRTATAGKIGDALRGRQRSPESVAKAWKARKGNLRNICKPTILRQGKGTAGLPYEIQPDGRLILSATDWDFLQSLHLIHNRTREALIFTILDGWVTIWGYRSFSKARQVRMFKRRLETSPLSVTFNVDGESHTLEGLRAYWPHEMQE